MQKRYAPLLVVLGLAIIATVAGIVLKTPEPLSPMRILMPNAGGRVVFDHRQHTEDYAGIMCADCHHEREVASYNPQPCGSCHGVTFDADFIATHQQKFADDFEACLTCHHTEIANTLADRDNIHALHEDIVDCASCHHEIEDFGMDAQSCSTEGCHEKLVRGEPVPQDASPLLLRDAVHASCRSCHEDMFENELEGCANCHSFTQPRKNFVMSGMAELSAEAIASFSKCASCHYEKPYEEIFPDRMSAYHNQCGNCHAKMGGPSVEQDKEQCYQCHIR